MPCRCIGYKIRAKAEAICACAFEDAAKQGLSK